MPEEFNVMITVEKIGNEWVASEVIDITTGHVAASGTGETPLEAFMVCASRIAAWHSGGGEGWASY